MLKYSKIALLIAPIVIAASSGCAVHPKLAKVEATEPQQEQLTGQSRRLLDVAEKYEQQDKPEIACRLYEHVLAEEPENRVARDRLETLVASTDMESDVLNTMLAVERDDSKTRLASLEEKPADEQKVQNASHPLKDEAPAKSDVAQQKTKQDVSPSIDETPQKPDVKATEVAVEKPDLKGEEQGEVNQDLSRLLASMASLPEIAPVEQQPGSDDFSWAGDPQLSETSPQSESSSSDDWMTASRKPVLEAPALDDAPLSFPKGGDELQDNVELLASQPFTNEQSQEVQPKETVSRQELFGPKVAVFDAAWSKPIGWHEVASGQTGTTSSHAIVRSDRTSSDGHRNVAGQWQPRSVKRLCSELSPELSPLVDMLDSSDPMTRVNGLAELGVLGDQATPTILAVRALMNDRDALVRAHAAGAVRDIEGDAWDSVRTLTDLLHQSDDEVLRLSAYLLGKMGPEAMDGHEALARLRDSDRGMTSLYAAEALTRITPDDPASFDVLEQAFESDDRDLRWFSAVSLGGVGDGQKDRAAEVLKVALKDRDSNVRVAAALSLGGLGESAATAKDELKHASLYDAPEVRDAAMTALACLPE